MKIAYVVYDYLCPGGIERYVRFLAEQYSRTHEVHVVTARQPSISTTITFHPISVPTYLPAFLRLLLFSKRAEMELRRNQYDVIHAQGADCRIHNVLTAHSCHKAWVVKASNSGFWERFKKTVNPLHALVLRNEKYNYEHLRKGTAVSNEVKKEIIQYYGVQEELIEVIYPGVDMEKVNPGNRECVRPLVRQRLGLNENDFALLFVSNEFRRKGLMGVIRALSRIKSDSIKLLVVGRGNRIPYRIAAMIRGVHDRLRFIRQTPEVEEYYAASDLFVLPTKHEAFGMVITEAMSSGLPVIVSRLAGAAELIHDGRCLLDDPEDIAEISSKVQFFNSNRDAAREVGTVLKKIAEKHTWDVTAERTMQVYRQVTGK